MVCVNYFAYVFLGKYLKICLQEFLNKYSESKFEFADSTINFGRHRIVECAREILEKSQNGALTKDYFIQISDDLEMLLLDVRCLDRAARTCTCTRTHTHSLSHSHTFQYADTHTCAFASLHAHTHALMYTHTHTPLLFLSVFSLSLLSPLSLLFPLSLSLSLSLSLLSLTHTCMCT